MKKTLLVAALATGFAGVAHAESSVTLYGIVDGGIGFEKQSVKAEGVKVSSSRTVGAREGIQNGNRWGLKGTEDLGNGTAAIFQLESGFNLANGKAKQNGGVFSRKAIIGLTGDSWGTFTLGRQFTASDDFVSAIDPFGTGFSQASANSTFGDSVGARKDAVIKYLSPNFDGFGFGVSLTTANTKTYNVDTTTALVANSAGVVSSVTGLTYPNQTVKTKDNGVSVALGYNNGPLQVAANFDYERVKKTVSNLAKPVTDSKAKAWNLGLAYDFDVVKLHLMYGQQRDGFVNGSSGLAGDLVDGLNSVRTATNQIGFDAPGLRAQAWLAGLSAPVGENGKVMFSYQGGRVKNSEVYESARINTHVWSLGYRQGLSKRTSVYALASYGYSKAKEDTGYRAKLKSTDVAVGLTHRF
ncbi:porin [Pelistega suis]|uniref:Porin n=1 Tax=Pelistega suis TaxID=1631957 RepID=A0A849P454_9BURK|nr:porin [Pelistega suis]NOL51124.1 porin [Pelistega suis]